MDNKKYGIKYILLRAGACFITGVFISMILIGGHGSFAWFTDVATGKASVSVMSTGDILDTFEVDREQNPTKIILSKAKGLDFDPVIYFAVEGEISGYLRHIDPVRLTGKEEVALPLTINLDQYRELQEGLDSEGSRKGSDAVKGKIWIKYLNEFIDEPLSVSFSKDYLIEKFERDCERLGGKDAREDSPGVELCGYRLSKMQQRIIELLAPGLLDYISGLIDTVNQYMQEIGELTDRLSTLELRNQALMLENEELESRKDTGTIGGTGGMEPGIPGSPVSDVLDDDSGDQVPGGLDGGSIGNDSGDGITGETGETDGPEESIYGEQAGEEEKVEEKEGEEEVTEEVEEEVIDEEETAAEEEIDEEKVGEVEVEEEAVTEEGEEEVEEV